MAKKGGRKKYEPNEVIAAAVFGLRIQGFTPADIAEAVGISQSTLRKYYKKDLEMSRKVAGGNLVGRLYDRAMTAGHNEDATLLKYACITIAGLVEREEVSSTVNNFFVPQHADESPESWQQRVAEYTRARNKKEGDESQG